MADGNEIRAPLVVSDAGVPNTVHRLMPEGTPGREALRATLQHTARSASHICLYVGLDSTDEELGLSRSNLWVYHSPDQDGDLARYLADPEAPLPLTYISFPSAKDPDFANRHPGKATVEVVSIAPYDRFKQWEDTKWMKRGEDYEAIKDELSSRLIEVLEREVPQIAGKIAYSELSTPLSTRHFAAYDAGEIYGLEHTPARFRERALRPKTGLKGFYLTPSFAGTCWGRFHAATKVSGDSFGGRAQIPDAECWMLDSPNAPVCHPDRGPRGSERRDLFSFWKRHLTVLSIDSSVRPTASLGMTLLRGALASNDIAIAIDLICAN